MFIAIGEDNAPSLRDLEQRLASPPTRQFAVEADPGRYYFANFALYRTGLDADLLPARDSQINEAVMDIIAKLNNGGIDSLEPTNSGNPLRIMELPGERHQQLHVCVGVLTTSPTGLLTPTTPELHQFFAFLSRCHPLT